MSSPNPNSDDIRQVEDRLKELKLNIGKKLKSGWEISKQNYDEKTFYMSLEKQQTTSHKIDKLQTSKTIMLNEQKIFSNVLTDSTPICINMKIFRSITWMRSSLKLKQKAFRKTLFMI